MKRWLRPLLLPWLRRPADEVERVARDFDVEHPRSVELVRKLGRAFIAGYNAMLEAPSLPEVRRRGLAYEPHWCPFFFEGAAMGCLPRAWYSRDVSRPSAESSLLELDPAYRYLYDVGFGFWYGFRHARRPERVEELASTVDAFHLPLCWDGWGFKRAFFDHARAAEVPALAERCAPHVRAQVWQGFGRATFFRAIDRPDRFDDLVAPAGAAHRWDVEFGRALALAFTGIDRPETIFAHLDSARDAAERSARLTGVTWALTARRMNDRDYYRSCLERGPSTVRERLERLPDLCEAAKPGAASYADWQARTRNAVTA